MFQFKSKKSKFGKLLQEAEGGIAEAQYNLGRMYEYGQEPVVKSIKAAIEWYLKAATQGHIKAQYNLAWKYLNGQDISKNRAEGIKWLQQAAEQNFIQAQLDLAGIYEEDQEKMSEAAQLYYKVASRGHVAAQYKLGWMHENGLGVLQNNQAAIAWYESAAKQGHAPAQTRSLQLQRDPKKIEPTLPQEKRSLFLGMMTHHRSCLNANNPLMDSNGCLNISLNISYTELEFEKKLEGGGTGVVYKGRWQNCIVAIKELQNVKIAPETIKEFQMEVSIMAKLRHPNIVQLYGVCLDPEHCCIIMEYMAKGSLYNILQNEVQILSWNIRKQIAIDISRGIAYLHNQNIQHRDLKSLNILLNDTMQAKLADFGLSKIKTDTMAMTNKGPVGTIRWMAPELIDTGEIHFDGTEIGKYTKKSDIYSYGIILWELASRQVPFNEVANEFVIMKKVTEGQRPQIPKNCPICLAALITHCWAERPNDRPEIDEVVKILETQHYDEFI